MNLKFRFLGSILIFAVVAASQAQFVSYEAPGGSFLKTSGGANITAGNLNATGSSAVLEPGVTVPNTVFLRNTVLSNSAASAVANNQYFQFTLQANSGLGLDLLFMSFDAQATVQSMQVGWVLRSSIDGFATDVATSQIPSDSYMSHFNAYLGDLSTTSITAPITFRFYGYSPTAQSGIYFDNIKVFYGVSTPVPEPFTMALMGLGAAAALRRKLRKS